MTTQTLIAQKAEYTYKYNRELGRHGWLRLTPAYSVKMVEEIISKYDKPIQVFDPFSGTATTALSAAYHGHESTTTDINPFLVWLGEAKTRFYTQTVIQNVRELVKQIQSLTRRHEFSSNPPPLYNIERWWSPAKLSFLCRLQGSIKAVTEIASLERDLLLLSFCRTMIELSNASFNHQSMSFTKGAFEPEVEETILFEKFSADLEIVLQGAAKNPFAISEVLLADARNPQLATGKQFDLVITSPPYVNRMSYIRELRPYMYWLEFLTDTRTAGELDWAAIGGTWGIATSRLTKWRREPGYFAHSLLENALEKISSQENKNGKLLANYIAKYFDDMWQHFQQLRFMLKSGANIHYIVGNSTFYNVLLPVEQIYVAMLRKLGFENVECTILRKRNSKKELIEFDVKATWKY